MDLIDLLDENGLQQDEWSLTAPRFGEEQQLEVVGWSGKTRGNRGNKYYILKCSVCSVDSELFGGGYFKSKKCHLLVGSLPCGCASNPHWNENQYRTICTRKAQELGYTFLGFDGVALGRLLVLPWHV